MNHVAYELVTVRGHCDQVALFACCCLRDLLRGITARKNGIGFHASLLELVSELLDVLAILFHLFALAKLELLDVSRGPSVSDVNQDDSRFADASELSDVIDDCIIVRGVLDGYENFLVHWSHAPVKNWMSSQMLSVAIIPATR
jgi:hypothetical protein